MIPKTKKLRKYLSIRRDDHEMIMKVARATGRTFSDIVCKAIKADLDKTPTMKRST